MKKGLLLALFAVVLIVTIAGCGRQYTLAISVEGEGQVAPTPGVHQYKRDTPVPMMVAPATGWGFAGWGGPDGDAVTDNTIVMDGNKYVTAIFVKLLYPLEITVEPADAGSVEVVILPQSRGIEAGQTVRLTASPEYGYVFDHWDDNAGDTTNPKSFVMDAAKTVKAVFRVQAPTYNLAVGVEGEGQVNPATGVHAFERNKPVALTTTPATGWGLAGWGGPNGSEVTGGAILMNGDKYITAVFAKLQYPLDITVEPAAAGTVDVVIMPPSRGIEYGQTVRLTAVPGYGYVFDHWDNDTTDIANPKSFAMNSAKNVKAVFRAETPTYNLAVSVEGEGQVSPAPGIHAVERDKPAALTTTPAAGWGFTGWGGPNGNEVNDNAILMNGNKYITAVFRKLEYSLSTSVEPVGAGTVDVAIVADTRGIAFGQTVRITAVPNAGFVFGYWNNDAGHTVNPSTFVMDGPKSVKATFVAKVADPVFSPSQGTFDSPISVGITCATTGATIRYTTDGVTAPTSTEGTVYAGPIQLSRSTVIQAVAFKEGRPDSAVVTRTFTLRAPTPVIGLAGGHHEGPQSVTIAAPGMTVRYTLDGTTPSPISGILYTGPVSVDKTCTLQAVAYGADLSPSRVATQDYIIYRWACRAPMPTPRQGLAVVELGGKIFAIGGTDGSDSNDTTDGSEGTGSAATAYFNTVEVYNPATDTWTTGTPMPTGRAYLSAVVLNGKIYAMGGRTASSSISKIVEVYDPTTDTWTRQTDMLNATGLFTALAMNGVIHAVGGGSSAALNGSELLRRDQQEYDPNVGSWMAGVSCPVSTTRNYGAAGVGNLLYLFGGDGDPSPDMSVNSTLIFDTVTQAWTGGAGVPYSIAQCAAAVVDGRIYVFGGISKTIYWGNTVCADVSIYDPVANTWAGGLTLPSARYLHAAASIGSSVYLVGGTSDGTTVLSDITEFEIVK